jgi:DNA-binding beta-propeller fold protein YncE
MRQARPLPPRALASIFLLSLIAAAPLRAQREPARLYVAAPSDDADRDRSIRLLVFDTGSAHRFLKRFVLWQTAGRGDPETVRGIAASAGSRRLFISTTKRLAAVDLKTAAILWEKSYEDQCCDRFALSPDDQTILAPAFGSSKWYVINAATGELRATVSATGWSRETHYAPDGKRAYLAAWESTTLSVADTTTHEVIEAVGPFSGFLCPMTMNAKGTLVFANIDGFVGFEVADLQTGFVLDTVTVEDVAKDSAAEYECPSHGIAFTRNGGELWVADGVRNRLHVFDATDYPPVATTAIDLPAQPRWITFSLDGRYAYASTGDVIDVQTKKIVGALEDEKGAKVNSPHMVEAGE